MERLSDTARGYAVIKAVGVEPTGIIDRCAAEGLEFWGAYPEDDYTIIFRTRLNKAQTVLGFAEKCGCELEILEKRGVPIEAKKLKRRYVLWGLPLFLLAMLVFSSFFIWKIDVENFTAFILVDDKGHDFFKELKPWTGCSCNK